MPAPLYRALVVTTVLGGLGRLLHSIHSNVVYDFGSAAVPEPATWLLVSGGAMAWPAGRRMRRSRRESPEA